LSGSSDPGKPSGLTPAARSEAKAGESDQQYGFGGQLGLLLYSNFGA